MAGKRHGMASVMGRVMQSIGLSIAGGHQQGEPCDKDQSDARSGRHGSCNCFALSCHFVSPNPVTPDRGLLVLQAGLLAGGMMICLLPGFPVAYDRPKPLTVAGAALVLGPDMGHPHQIPVSVPNALHPMNTLQEHLWLA